VRITSGGSVGIGTISPSEKFHVVTSTNYAATFNTTSIELTTTRISLGGLTTGAGGSGGTAAIGCEHYHAATAQSSLLFYTYGGSLVEHMRITSGGNVGIGTTSPLSKLQVSSDFGKTDTTNRTIGAFTSNDASNPSRINFGITGGASQSARVGTIQTDEFGVVSGGSLSLQPFGGNLLIGTTTDAGFKLDVNGTFRATSLIKSGGTSSQFLKADGSVDSSAYITGLSWAGLTGKPPFATVAKAEVLESPVPFAFCQFQDAPRPPPRTVNVPNLDCSPFLA
jgi:hypothetical protein